MPQPEIVCQYCCEPIKGDHLRENDRPAHIRCVRRRIEQQPNFIGWVKKPR